MTAIDDLFPLPSPNSGSYISDGTSPIKPWFGIDPALQQTGQWASNTSTASQINDTLLIQQVYRESFQGQVETLTQIVSDNANYLLKQINVEVGPKDTVITVNIGKNKMTPPQFTFPNGEMNHRIGKKYMDWLAMVQLILQDA